MLNDAPISQTLKFHFGNTVLFAGSEDGILTRLLFDAESRRLTHLAVKQGHFFGKIHYLPFETVTRATGDGIWLNSTLAAASTIEGPGMAFDGHTVVKGSTGTGTLALAAVSPASGELVYIVAHNLLPGRDTLLHTSHVAALSSDQLTIAADATLLGSLPPYRSDRELQQEVEQIMFDLPFLHIDLKGMNLRVLDSVLYMDGNISSTLRGELALDQVAGIDGLLEVKNNLVGDDTLAAQIALALGQDERTRELPIGVYPQLGVVRLSGAVHNVEQRSIAAELASKFAGVRSVLVNLLIDPSADMLYVMSGQEGGETRDLVPGKFIRHTN